MRMTLGLAALLALSLAAADAAEQPVAGGSEASASPAQPAEGPGAGGTDAGSPTAAVTPHRRPRSARQGIDDSVRRLTRELDLAPEQQVRLRGILVEEHRQLREAATGGPPNADHVGRTKQVLDRTRERIRGMLTDEQRKKYPGVTPSDLLGPAHADVEGWIRATQGKSGAPPAGTQP